MNRIVLAMLFVLLSVSAYSHNELSTITKKGGDVYITFGIDECHEINYWFKKCMANDLFTFYRVVIDSCSTGARVINEANSDNIGPFEIQNGGWCGGNHLFLDGRTKTADTFSVKLYADDRVIASDTVLKARSIRFEVKNHIFNPLSAIKEDDKIYFTDTLCIENVVYTVIENSVQVDLFHEYTNKIPVVISKYYGMQSMFKNETMILTPLGAYESWTDINSVDRFKKKDFPRFNQYIEKNDFCFQASFLLDRGLGTHNELSDDDVIFIGNSWTKCYHKLMGNVCRIRGNSDFWSGVYTWGTTPLFDTGAAFAYDGFVDGKETLFFSNNTKGDFIITSPSETLINKKVSDIKNLSGIKMRIKKNKIHFSCQFPGSLIVSFGK